MPSYLPIGNSNVKPMPSGTGTIELLGPDGKPLPPEAFSSPFDAGPIQPLRPTITVPYAPREFQYSPGINLVTTPRTEDGRLSFPALHALVDACPYVRIAINYRKNQIRALEWDIVPREDENRAARKARQKDIDKAKAWLRVPNRVDGLTLSPWLGQVLEELLVTDALVLYKQRRMDGSLHSLVQIDGSTIKPLIDTWGHVVGYQQILWGFPRTQFPNTPDDEDGYYSANDLIYLVSNPKVDSQYGTPPAEEIQPIVNVAIRRLMTQSSWYFDGNVPTAFIEAPEGWSDTTIAGFQEYLDLTFSGNTVQRSRMRLLPHGANYMPAKPFSFTKDEEEAILAQVLAHFGVPKHLLVAQTNRATAQTQSDEAEDTGLRPYLLLLEELLSAVIEQDLGIPDLRVKPIGTKSSKELEKAQANVAYVTAGILTADEVRETLGKDPIPEEAKPAAGIPALPPLPGKPPMTKPNEQGSPKSPPVPPNSETEKAELGAWRRWALKRVEKGKHRDGFEAAALPAELVADIRAALEQAGSPDDVNAIFDWIAKGRPKPRPLSNVARAKAEKKLAGVLHRWFEAEKARVLAMADAQLQHNKDEAAA
jgi:hypothetical protein